MTLIGCPIPRIDAHDKVTGRARYAADHTFPGALHMKILFAGRAHARIKGIDARRARGVRGVVAVLTAQDVPHNRYGLMLADQPVLCDQVVRFVGDQVAAVVAVSPEQAAASRERIAVQYEDLPVLHDPEAALEAGSLQIHEDYPGNIISRARIRRGDLGAALAKADLAFEHTYHTPMQEHAFLEPEAGLAYPDEDGCIVVRAAGQNVHDDQRQIAAALELPLDKVRVVYGPVGGAFGGREDVSVQILLALAAWKLGRPVKVQWTRRESILGHCKRHAMTIRHKWGAKGDGRLVAAEVHIVADAGAYAYTSPSVLECMHALCVGPYDIPNVKMDGMMVCTNNIPGGAFRGFGGPQASFAAELHISQMAERLGIDPLTMREINLLRDNTPLPTQGPIPGKVSLPGLLGKLAVEAGLKRTDGGWHFPRLSAPEGKRRGLGIALGFRQSGIGYGFPEGSEAEVILHGGSNPESAEIHCAAVDVGQGSHSALLQIAASILPLAIDRITLHSSDSALIGDAGPASASRLTIMAGQAVKLAAEAALKAWADENRPAVGHARWEAPPTTAPDGDSGACNPNLSYSFAAQAVEAEVDMQTGAVDVQKVLVVQDPGRALNPQQVLGQIQGAVVQAQGWSIYEDFITQRAIVASDQLSTYLLPTCLDIPPQLEAFLVEEPDPLGSFGFRGVGEMPFVPFAPALASAIRDATGLWVDTLPIAPARMLSLLGQAAQARDYAHGALEIGL
jgi:CO/xanthine dehydrogenase Mo-binding subunit